MMGMREAVDRVKAAVAAKEKVLIWGDLDVDGTTGTVLLRKTFSLLGLETTTTSQTAYENRGSTLNRSKLRGPRDIRFCERRTDVNFDESPSERDRYGHDHLRTITRSRTIRSCRSGASLTLFTPTANIRTINLAASVWHSSGSRAFAREFELESEIPGLLKIADHMAPLPMSST